MNLLVDTHAIIWFITEDDQLPIRIKALIEDPSNTCFVRYCFALGDGHQTFIRETGFKSRSKENI
jgi:hypothetical protein